MSVPKSKSKYRPVLKVSQIIHILKLAKSESPISSASISVIGTLAPFLAKIENDGIQAAYTIAPTIPKQSTLESLGGDRLYDDSKLLSEISAEGLALTKEEIWEKAYVLYKTNPTFCSLDTIQAAREHMYLNELMSPEETTEFEKETATKYEYVGHPDQLSPILKGGL